jgi:hypothetical protein
MGINLLRRWSLHVHPVEKRKNIHVERKSRSDGRRRIIAFTDKIEHTLTKRAILLADLKVHVDISFIVSS